MKDNNKNNEFLFMTLCPVCSQQFQNTPDLILSRANPYQEIMEPCTYCNYRMGYDYIVKRMSREGER